MSRTYPHPTQAATYTCPCSCSSQLTRDKLDTHLQVLMEASVARHRATYLKSGIPFTWTAECAVRQEYLSMHMEALTRTVPDWRDSDGMRGYATRTVRYVAEETL